MVVEHDGNRLVEVLLSDASPLASALVVHCHRHYVTLHVIEVAACVGDYATIENRATLVGFESHEVKPAVLVVDSLNRPASLEVRRKNLSSLLRVEDCIDGSGICYGNSTDNRATHLTGAPQELGERTCSNLSRSLLGGSGSVGSQAIGRSSCGSSGVGSYLHLARSSIAQCHERLLKVGDSVCFVEFKVGSTLEQLAHALRLFHTGKLKKNATGALKLLNVRRNHTETVDTGSKHVA